MRATAHFGNINHYVRLGSKDQCNLCFNRYFIKTDLIEGHAFSSVVSGWPLPSASGVNAGYRYVRTSMYVFILVLFYHLARAFI